MLPIYGLRNFSMDPRLRGDDVHTLTNLIEAADQAVPPTVTPSIRKVG